MTCHDIYNAARAERLKQPLTEGLYKLEEARRDIAAWRELATRPRTGGKFRTDKNLGPCLAEGRGAYLKGLPARLARLIGHKILPGIAALAGDGVPPAEVERLLRRAQADAQHLIAYLESVRLHLKGGIDREYRAMRQGESSLIGLLDAASELLPGLVAYLCRSKCSFRPLCVRRPRGFFLPMLNADGAGYRSH